MLPLLLALSALCFYIAIAIVHFEAFRFALAFVPARQSTLVFFWVVVLWPLPWLLRFFGVGLQIEDTTGRLRPRILRSR